MKNKSEFDAIHIASKLENETILKHLVGDNKYLVNIEDGSVNRNSIFIFFI